MLVSCCDPHSENISMFWTSISPHVWRWNLRLQPRAQPGTPRSKTWHTEGNAHREQSRRVKPEGSYLGVFCTFTDQFEHPRAAAACRKTAKQSENNDGGSGPDEDIWRIGAFLGGQGEIVLQAHLPPHADGQQDYTCELRETAGRVSCSMEATERSRFFRLCLRYCVYLHFVHIQ